MTATADQAPAPAAAILPYEALSPAEERLERWRKVTGLILAPIAFTWILLLDFPTLSPQAHRLAGVMAAVVVVMPTTVGRRGVWRPSPGPGDFSATGCGGLGHPELWDGRGLPRVPHSTA